MKILVADDQPMIVEDILDELEKLFPESERVGTSEPSEIIKLFKDALQVSAIELPVVAIGIRVLFPI